MRPDMVVLFKPLIDDSLGLSGCCKPFSVEHFTTQRSVEAFVIAVLPGRAWIDVDRLDPDFGEPVFEGFGCKLRAIVRSQIFRLSAFEQQRIKRFENVR